MQCNSCGSQLPVDGGYCPACGAVTPYNISASGVSPYDPTAASSPPTDYGYPPYGMPQQNPYEPLNPYTAPPQPPSPPPSRRHLKISLLLGVGVLVLLLASVGGVALLQYSSARNAAAAAALATTTAHAHATATATARSIATATATAAIDPYPPTSGKLAFDDPLSQAYQWDDYTNASLGLTCQFSNGAYHLRESKIGSIYTCADQAQFSNIAFEVQMTILHGDCGGIIFRNNGTKYYLFQVCANGAYELDVGLDSTHFKALVNKYSRAITTGYNQLNTIAVVADGSTLDLYVNHTKIDSVSDKTSTGAGFIGLAAGAYTVPTEVAYSNAKVWTL